MSAWLFPVAYRQLKCRQGRYCVNKLSVNGENEKSNIVHEVELMQQGHTCNNMWSVSLKWYIRNQGGIKYSCVGCWWAGVNNDCLNCLNVTFSTTLESPLKLMSAFAKCAIICVQMWCYSAFSVSYLYFWQLGIREHFQIEFSFLYILYFILLWLLYRDWQTLHSIFSQHYQLIILYAIYVLKMEYGTEKLLSRRPCLFNWMRSCHKTV